MSKPAIFGLVKNELQARYAASALELAGFIASDISVLSGLDDYEIGGMEQIGCSKTRVLGHTNATKAPEGATTGVAAGGMLGGLAGWLVGIGALTLPGVGPFVAAGPILTALSGAALGATAGGLTGALIGYGIPEYEAKLFAGKLESGHILIGVHAINSNEADAAKKALASVGAEDIKTASEVITKEQQSLEEHRQPYRSSRALAVLIREVESSEGCARSDARAKAKTWLMTHVSTMDEEDMLLAREHFGYLLPEDWGS